MSKKVTSVTDIIDDDRYELWDDNGNQYRGFDDLNELKSIIEECVEEGQIEEDDNLFVIEQVVVAKVKVESVKPKITIEKMVK